jgi:hypothetical protein
VCGRPALPTHPCTTPATRHTAQPERVEADRKFTRRINAPFELTRRANTKRRQSRLEFRDGLPTHDTLQIAEKNLAAAIGFHAAEPDVTGLNASLEMGRPAIPAEAVAAGQRQRGHNIVEADRAADRSRTLRKTLRGRDIREIDTNRTEHGVAVLRQISNQRLEVPAEGLKAEKGDILVDGKQSGNRGRVLSKSSEEISLSDAQLGNLGRGVVQIRKVEIAHLGREGGTTGRRSDY